MDRLYTTHDISTMLQVDPSTVSKWIDKGVLLAFRTPGGHRRVRAGDLRMFLIKHEMPVPDDLGGGGVRLLAVDDEPSVLEALKRAFKPHRKQVELTVTDSSIEAVFMVVEQRPHGLLVDLNMPDMDGFD